jgi:hypothetical protein
MNTRASYRLPQTLGVLSVLLAACTSSSEPTAEEQQLSLDAQVPSAAACVALGKDASLSERTRAFMQTKHLIVPGEEDDSAGTKIRWVATATGYAAGKSLPGIVQTPICVVLMRLQMSVGGVSEFTTQGGFELLNFDGKGFTTMDASRSVKLPKTLRAQLGMQDDPSGNELGRWFYEFSGPSVAELVKEFLIVETFPQVPQTDGLIAAVEVNREIRNGVEFVWPTGRFSWDTTATRTWKLAPRATWSLRRGQTGEAFDVYAQEFDSALAGVSATKPLNAGLGFLSGVQPWGSGSLRSLFVQGSWRAAL